MRVSVLQDQFAAALKDAARFVDSRSTLPVIQNILLETNGGELVITATNLETTFRTRVGAKVDAAGAITLPTKTLVETIDNFSQERVDMTLDLATQTVTLRCGSSRANIKGIAATEFPAVPTVEGTTATLEAEPFKAALAYVLHAAATEDTRPILTGVNFQSRHGLILAAADGYRLSIAPVEGAFPQGDWTIPAKPLSNLLRLLDEEPVSITFEYDTRVSFVFGRAEVQILQLHGKFPDFNAIIPHSYSTQIGMYTADVLASCKRAEIFARDSNYSARLIAKLPTQPGEPGEAMMVGRSNDRGDMDSGFDVVIDGAALESAYNVRYLMDALKATATERVIIETMGAAHPVKVYGENSPFLDIIMPMQVGR